TCSRERPRRTRPIPRGCRRGVRARSCADQRVGQVGKRLRNRGEAEFPEETLEPRQRAAQPAVVPYPCPPGDPEARLLRIELPGMDVERAGRAAPLASSSTSFARRTESRNAGGDCSVTRA